jgi:hypothetical protein
MSETRGRKRLEPKITRGAFRFHLTSWSLIAALQAFLVLRQIGHSWDEFTYIWSALLALAVVNIFVLLYTRNGDREFCNEEGVPRPDWDPRGRHL